MTEQIYIDGVRMDMSGGKGVSLIFQSPYFTEIDNIVSNRTTAVDLPRTPNNLRAIGLENPERTDSDFAYRKHRAVYVRDGIQMFSGPATLQSITATALRFSFAWGNVTAFQQLLDASLRDLQTGDAADYVGYNDRTATTDARYYPAGWNERRKWGADAASIQPIMPVSKIVARIEARFGVRLNVRGATLPGTSPFDRYYVPLVSRSGDDVSLRRQGVEMGSTQIINVRGHLAGLLHCMATCMRGPTLDLNGMADGLHGTFINVGEIDRVRIFVPKGFQVRVANEPSPGAGGLNVMSAAETDETGVYTFGFLRAAELKRTVDDAGRAIYTAEQDMEFEVDTRGVGSIGLCIGLRTGTDLSTYPPPLACEVLTPGPVSVYDPAREALTYGEGAIFPLYRNLPDWSVSDFLKNLMKIEGLFACSTDDKTIEFVTVGDLYAARSRALDWTERITSAGGPPAELSTTYGNFARRNWFRWAEDETVQGNYDGYIDIGDENLDPETDLVKVDFAPTEDSIIPVWTRSDDGTAEWLEVEPRILTEHTETGASLSFDGLEWPTLIDTNYRSYRDLITRTRAVKVSVALDTWDLACFDAAVPVYARQWGRYYAVMKLTDKGDGTADAELLRMGRARVWPTAPAEPSPADLILKPVRLESGAYAITLDGKDPETIRRYIDDPAYCLVLMRYGYARRGKETFKQDRYFGRIGTHTMRKSGYRQFRGGLRYRIIGHDLLKGGKLAGQTAATARYKDATLVFDLLQEVKLPAMQSEVNFVTREKRLKNTSARGLGNLYVALVRKIAEKPAERDPLGLVDYGCVCVSNVLQVRGYTPDHKSWWEFE